MPQGKIVTVCPVFSYICYNMSKSEAIKTKQDEDKNIK